jgi:hypothetical protein
MILFYFAIFLFTSCLIRFIIFIESKDFVLFILIVFSFFRLTQPEACNENF